MHIQKIYTKLCQRNLEGLIVSSAPNISYLTNHTSRDSYLLVSEKANIYITDSRYIEEAKNNLKGVGLIIRQTNGSAFKVISEACQDLGLKRVGFEKKYLSFAGYKDLKKELGKKANLSPTYGLIEEFRRIKTEEELKKIERAIQITNKAFRFIKEFISPGRKEVEIAAELERFIRYNGAQSSAFDIIIASGPNSSFPHHITSERKVKNNEHVLVDLGVDYMGYKSDLTSVFFLGRINPAVKVIYDIVSKAQDRAIIEIKPDVRIKDVDTAARQYITQRGYGGFFGHSLGHGVGLEVHEEPRVSSKAEGVLKAGMIFTVEPGIYLPNKFGIRLENIVLVTKKGFKVLNGAIDK